MASASELIQRFREAAPTSQAERRSQSQEKRNLWWKEKDEEDESHHSRHPRHLHHAPHPPLGNKEDVEAFPRRSLVVPSIAPRPPIPMVPMNRSNEKTKKNQKNSMMTMTMNETKEKSSAFNLSFDLDALIANEIHGLEKKIPLQKKEKKKEKEKNIHLRESKYLPASYEEEEEANGYFPTRPRSIDTLGSTGFKGLLFPHHHSNNPLSSMKSYLKEEPKKISSTENEEIEEAHPHLNMSQFLQSLQAESDRKLPIYTHQIGRKEEHFDEKGEVATFASIVSNLDLQLQSLHANEMEEKNVERENASGLKIAVEEARLAGRKQERLRLLHHLDVFGEAPIPLLLPHHHPQPPQHPVNSKSSSTAPNTPSSGEAEVLMIAPDMKEEEEEEEEIVDMSRNPVQVVMDQLKSLSQRASSRAAHLSMLHATATDHRLLPTSALSSSSLAGPSFYVYSSSPSLASNDNAGQPTEARNCNDIHFPSIHATSKHIESSLSVAMQSLQLHLTKVVVEEEEEIPKEKPESASPKAATAPKVAVVEPAKEAHLSSDHAPSSSFLSKIRALDSLIGVSDSLYFPSTLSSSSSSSTTTIPLTAHHPQHASERQAAFITRKSKAVFFADENKSVLPARYDSGRESHISILAPSAPPLQPSGREDKEDIRGRYQEPKLLNMDLETYGDNEKNNNMNRSPSSDQLPWCQPQQRSTLIHTGHRGNREQPQTKENKREDTNPIVSRKTDVSEEDGSLDRKMYLEKMKKMRLRLYSDN